MKVAIIAAAGKAGRLIAKEAQNQGHEVTAIVRESSRHLLEGSFPTIIKDVLELTAEDLKGFDVVVNAFGTSFSKPGNEILHQEVMDKLIEVFKQLPNVRLMIVGGAGSLYTDREQKHQLIETIPADYRAVPENMKKAFEKLKNTDINWTYLSPAKNFDAAGVRTGRYMLGTDYVITNASGESYISYSDYAKVMVDEMTNKSFVRKRFTAVSDTVFYQDEKRLFNIAGNPFFRKFGYIGIYAEPMSGEGFGQAKLYLGSRRGAIACNPTNKLYDLSPVYEGKKVPYAVMTKADELIMQTKHGNISFCFAEPSLLLVKGEKGMSLMLETKMDIHGTAKKRGDDAWETVFRYVCSTVLKPLHGTISMDAPWKWEELSTPRIKAEVLPEKDGRFLCAIEEFTCAGWVRDHYPTYEEGLASVKEDWEDFLSKIPHFVQPFEEKREEAAWILWSHLVGPSGKIKRPLMYMTATMCASEWQMCHNAVALNNNMELAIELLLNMFDEASPVGQLPDYYDDMRGINQMTKPPLQGWALKWIMKTHNLALEVPAEKLEKLYNGCVKWADWFMKYRDDDHDGIPQYEHGDETGFDDASVFKLSMAMETPDLPAYLALLYESLGDLAKILGKGEKEANGHYARSKELIDKLVKYMWNGERFIATVPGTHEVVATDSFMYYLPIVLGKRLPQEIIDKLAADLSVEGDLLTPYGLTCEKMSTSDDFRVSGMSKGYVLPPSNLLITTGLYDAGKTDLAKLIARRYCLTTKDGGISMMINPFVGSRGVFSGSWPACVFIVLAGLCG